MKVFIAKTPEQLGIQAAKAIAGKINEAIAKNGSARIVLSTGASQFDTIQALLAEDVDWGKVTMFHLDEYIGLPESHPASFRKYLKERFVSKIPLGRAVFVNGEGDAAENIAALSKALTEQPIDVGVIGIGENAHIAFNDPPADFETTLSYIIVRLDDKCKTQQVNEGWFESVDAVPEQAVTMTPYRIMQCKSIISPVPNRVKAQAIKDTLESKAPTNQIPATLLKTHADITLFIDENSASLCGKELLDLYV